MARDATQYTPMMQQYLKIKEDYREAIVFFRLGDFYEMFFEDALLASKALEIQLTARDAGTQERVPMCGVPHHSAESYINRLIDLGYKVAICEQVEAPSADKKIVRREVVRLVTPGTNMDDVDAAEYFIASLGFTEFFYTLAYLNMATGQSFALKLPKDATMLMNELSTLSLKEIIVSDHFNQEAITPIIRLENITVSVHRQSEIDASFNYLFKHLPTEAEQKGARRLISYLIQTQKRTLMHIKPFELVEQTATLKMDANTIRHLELLKTVRQNNTKGSLFWLLNHTQTAMGSRRLKQQILRPLIHQETLNIRYDFVEALNQEFIVKNELKARLKEVYDLERIVGRIAYGNCNGKDLVQLRRSLGVLPDFQDQLNQIDLEYSAFLSRSIDPLKALHKHLFEALLDEQPLSIKEGQMFKQGYSKTLDNYKDAQQKGQTWLHDLAEEERLKTGIKKLKIGYNRVFGYFIEIPKGQIHLVKPEFGYHRKQTLSNAERYITEALKEKEKQILSSEEKSIQLEYDLFIALKETIEETLPIIQKNAEILSEIDMFIAFSEVSEKYNMIRPTLTETHKIDILKARHPIVESMLEGTQFIANDITMDATTSMLLITGPNMSGKSTYMRTLAIIVILAQIGSFVPAEAATLPIFDQLFTRIGATDDLISGKSTFMVEMIEANHAIQNATHKSLILFDEIGRGTSTYDGLAIAQAIIEYIHQNIRCKTLFSTHYHELTELENSLETLKNIHVAATESEGKIVFLHQVKPGKADKSYGINVASLAQLPERLIKRSQMLLKALEKNKPQEPLNLFDLVSEQPEAPPHPHEAIIEKIKMLSLDDMKPIDALNTLYALMNEVKKRR